MFHLADINLTPDPQALPGGSTLQGIANGVMAFALVVTGIAFLVSAATWGLAGLSGNVQFASMGRRGVGAALVAALLIGAAATIVNFFFKTGQALH
jgi:hypothetical protein